VFEALRPVERRTIVTCHDFFNSCPNGGFVNFTRSEPCRLRPLSAACLASQCDRRSPMHKYWRTARHVHLGRLARFAGNRATFTFLHRRMRDRFVEAGFEAADLRVVPNPVEPWTRERVGAEANSRLLFVGRVGRDKGADIAAEAAHAANVPLTVVGTGELAEDLPVRFAGVEMAGWRDRAGIVAAARRARALVAPSRVVEPFGLAILEAAMSGLPVLVSDRAYLAQDAVRDEFGIAFNPSDLAGLAEIIARIGRDDELVRRMSCNGLSRAAAYTQSAAEWANAFLEIFREKLSTSSAARGRVVAADAA
jgi:glycosyltransferase involved in cell wall biosynthesis